MSLVEKIDYENRNMRFHDAAYTTYSVGHNNNETRVQLQSYDSDNRAKVGTASQILQFNKDSAIELIRIFDKEFGLHINFD